MNLQPPSSPPHRKARVPFIQVICSAIILVAAGMFVAGIPYRYAELQEVCPTGQDAQCFGAILTADQARGYAAIGISLQARAAVIIISYIAIALANVALAALMVWRRPDNWFIIFLALAFVAFNTDSTTPALAEAHPFWRVPVSWLGDYGAYATPFIFYLFPNGRFVPRWTRYLFIAWVLAILALSLYKPAGSLGNFLEAAWIGVFVGGMLAQIYRYLRRSTPVERQQIKWIVLLLAVTAVTIPINLVLGRYVQAQPSGPGFLLSDIIDHMIGLLLGIGIPLVFGIAIFQYRLWEIDVIIRRTLVYGALTATLFAAYFASVVVLQEVFQVITGQHQSPIATVISTLGIAALFTPLRRRIQNAIDRRFYRRKYDAEKTLAAFSASLREEVDLGQLSDHLLAVVEETVQPESVSLWLKEH